MNQGRRERQGIAPLISSISGGFEKEVLTEGSSIPYLRSAKLCCSVFHVAS